MNPQNQVTRVDESPEPRISSEEMFREGVNTRRMVSCGLCVYLKLFLPNFP